MATKRNGLGKGLDSMIPNKNVDSKPKTKLELENANEISVMVNINKVEPNKLQPRKNFDEDALEDLADSIKQYGVISPLIVQQRDGYYEIIAGERRWRASKKAGLKEVPVIIKNYDEQEIVEISLIENLQRENLNPIEEALGYKRLIDEFNLKQDEVAERVSKSRTTITNSMRLLKLDDRVQQMIIEDVIQTGHARAILGITDGDKQYEFAQRILDEGLNVREVEREVKKINEGKNATKKSADKGIDDQMKAVYHEAEEVLRNLLGTKVAINYKDANKGKIEIEYYTAEELNRLVEVLETIPR